MYPLVRQSKLSELSPSVHWAQQHTRSPQFPWSRQIYDFELLYVLNGEISAKLQNTTYVVPAGNLLYISAGIHHTIEVISEPHVQLLGIHFDYFDELQVEVDEDIIVDQHNIQQRKFCREPVVEGFRFVKHPVMIPTSQMISLMEFIIHEWNTQEVGYMLSCKGLLLQLIPLFMRLQQQQRVTHPRYEQGLLELMQRLETDYKRRWSAGDMAQLLNIHEDYLSKLFKAKVGMTPIQYLQHIRHIQAKQRLRETDDKMETIAIEVGYSDLHYFSRVFKRREGITAQQYRKLARIY